MALATYQALCIDAADAPALGAFWAAALGMTMQEPEDGALGATVLDADSFPWALMADPEGGELCAFVGG